MRKKTSIPPLHLCNSPLHSLLLLCYSRFLQRLESDPPTLISKLGRKPSSSDPLNLTGNWFGSNVCDYTGILCSPSLKDPHLCVVSSIDLNHGDIAG
ncbi:hypothetical protein MRB53_004712 [Persea americana]|uniref:Uncharacterized protein n=1 Tax=Persea americana TaxID=3435 RepID=A0ACC2MBG2_PERAE|nr:hypothetical protein MRB53_004712 [Persea americana]